jgi:hypothetical protein
VQKVFKFNHHGSFPFEHGALNASPWNPILSAAGKKGHIITQARFERATPGNME